MYCIYLLKHWPPLLSVRVNSVLTDQYVVVGAPLHLVAHCSPSEDRNRFAQHSHVGRGIGDRTLRNPWKLLIFEGCRMDCNWSNEFDRWGRSCLVNGVWSNDWVRPLEKKPYGPCYPPGIETSSITPSASSCNENLMRRKRSTLLQQQDCQRTQTLRQQQSESAESMRERRRKTL